MATIKPFMSFRVESNQDYTDFGGPQVYRNFPVRFSIPLAAGVSAPTDSLTLRDERGEDIASASRAFLLWPDGSVRTWEVSFALNQHRGQTVRFDVFRAKGAPNQPRESAPLVASPQRVTLSSTLADGAKHRTEINLEPSAQANPVEVSEHEFTLGSFRGAIVRKRWNWCAGVELEVRVTNSGTDEVTNVGGLKLEFELPAPVGEGARYVVRQTCMTALGHPRLVERQNPIDVRADARGVRVPEAAQLGEDESNYPPYERDGYVLGVSPWVGVTGSESAWALVVPDALERMPKAWRIDGRKVAVELHPEDAPPLAWRQGMTLFQRVVLVRLAGGGSAGELENAAQSWLRPPIVRLDPEIYRKAGWRIPFVFNPKRFPKTEFQFRDSFNFGWTRGTFDWGDQLADNKGGSHGPTGGKPTVARNLEYDFVSAAAKEYARTGVASMLKMCRSSAEHMMYTDFVAHSDDPWKLGGIVHHCVGHTSGSAYPSHMWAEGLTLYHQLSGDPQPLRVAKRVGDFYLKYINERMQIVQSTAREMGWLLIALSAIYDVTREQRYLDGIRRVVDYNIDRGRAAFFPTDATFTIGVAIIGFDRSRHFHRDKDTRKFILELLDWMMAGRRDDIGLFEYWLDPETGAIPYVQTHLPEALNIGFQLSGDDKYLRAAYRLYQIHQGGGHLTVQNRLHPPECGFAAGNHLSWMGCLQSFAEKGWLDRHQYPDPE